MTQLDEQADEEHQEIQKEIDYIIQKKKRIMEDEHQAKKEKKQL